MRASPAHSLALVAALALPLAACKQQPTVSATNATAAQVQEKVAAATGGAGVTIEPGRWEGAVTIHDMDIPGMPPQVKAQMKKQMGGAKSFAHCVTAEDVKQQKALFTGEGNDEACKYDHFNMAAGTIDAAMSCFRDAYRMEMTMTGTYSSDAYHMDMASKAEASGPMGASGPLATAAMNMKMTVEAKRVGACKGTKDEL